MYKAWRYSAKRKKGGLIAKQVQIERIGDEFGKVMADMANRKTYSEQMKKKGIGRIDGHAHNY